MYDTICALVLAADTKRQGGCPLLRSTPVCSINMSDSDASIARQISNGITTVIEQVVFCEETFGLNRIF